MEENKITACLVIHNEEAVLARCLESVVRITKSILVVHDGECRDRSLAICKRFGASVTIRRFVGEAEPHRAWLLTQVKTPYCFQIDADEYVSDELIKDINSLTSQEADGYTCIWPFWNGRAYQTSTWPRKLCLYKIAKISYLAAPHESVRVQGSIIDTPYVLHHKPDYDNLSPATFRSKWLVWAKIHARYYSTPTVDIDRFNDPKRRLTIHYAHWMRYAPWSALPLALYHSLASLLSGGWREGIVGIKSSVFMGLYYASVCYFVWRERKL